MAPSSEWSDTRQALIGQEYETGLLKEYRRHKHAKLHNSDPCIRHDVGLHFETLLRKSL